MMSIASYREKFDLQLPPTEPHSTALPTVNRENESLLDFKLKKQWLSGVITLSHRNEPLDFWLLLFHTVIHQIDLGTQVSIHYQ